MRPDPRAVRAIVEFGAQQKVAELSALIGLIEERRQPLGCVLEIGSWTGGTLWLWTQLAKQVVSIDIAEVPTGHIERGKQLVIVRGLSQSELTRDLVAHLQPDMLFIDGDHRYAQARRDWELYSPLVPAGGMVVLHDIAKHAPGVECEVDRLWAELKAQHLTREFVTPVDVAIEPPIDPRSALPEQGAGIGVVLV